MTKVASVEPIPVSYPEPNDFNALRHLCLVKITTDDGLVGWGEAIAQMPEASQATKAIIEAMAERVIGRDPVHTRAIWESIRDQAWWYGYGGGVASNAVAAIDIALWDLKGKALKQPVWRLLGGAHPRVPVYATFGFGFFDREQLAAAAKLWVSQGFKRLKMTVANEALRHRDSRPIMEVIREDAARVKAVREAVGPDVELFIDANCNLDLYHATKLVEMIKPYGISFFEEPLTQNDVSGMAQLRRATGMALACGQNEGLAFRFRDLLVNQAIDYAQPNVAITGGFTQCVKIAGMAQAFNVSIANGGAWGFHNMHLQAGVANGTLVEHHYLAVELYKQIYRGLPEPADGYFTMPETPGLGFEPNRDAIAEIAKLPLSQGRGKG
jgi:L-rhamnonate dehydratase